MGDAVKKAIEEVRAATRAFYRATPGTRKALGALDRYDAALDALVTAARLEGAEAMRQRAISAAREYDVEASVAIVCLSPATVVSDAARRAT